MILDLNYSGSSFFDYLRSQQSHLVPSFNFEPAKYAQLKEQTASGTTILALMFSEGVIIAGDRMATEGYQVSSRRIEKVFKADGFSAIAIAGTAGPCIEVAKIFQTEIEHYEKIEGEPLGLEGKANKLANIVKMNLPAALQGLLVIPIYAGFDTRLNKGRIFKYDITGGRYEELDFHATGSGGKDARGTLKKFFREQMPQDEALKLVVESLIDAADEDIATSGPDPVRGLYPQVKIISAKGIMDVPENEIKKIYQAVAKNRASSASG